MRFRLRQLQILLNLRLICSSSTDDPKNPKPGYELRAVNQKCSMEFFGLVEAGNQVKGVEEIGAGLPPPWRRPCLSPVEDNSNALHDSVEIRRNKVTDLQVDCLSSDATSVLARYSLSGSNAKEMKDWSNPLMISDENALPVNDHTIINRDDKIMKAAKVLCEALVIERENFKNLIITGTFNEQGGPHPTRVDDSDPKYGFNTVLVGPSGQLREVPRLDEFPTGSQISVGKMVKLANEFCETTLYGLVFGDWNNDLANKLKEASGVSACVPMTTSEGSAKVSRIEVIRDALFCFDSDKKIYAKYKVLKSSKNVAKIVGEQYQASWLILCQNLLTMKNAVKKALLADDPTKNRSELRFESVSTAEVKSGGWKPTTFVEHGKLIEQTPVPYPAWTVVEFADSGQPENCVTHFYFDASVPAQLRVHEELKSLLASPVIPACGTQSPDPVTAASLEGLITEIIVTRKEERRYSITCKKDAKVIADFERTVPENAAYELEIHGALEINNYQLVVKQGISIGEIDANAEIARAMKFCIQLVRHRNTILNVVHRQDRPQYNGANAVPSVKGLPLHPFPEHYRVRFLSDIAKTDQFTVYGVESLRLSDPRKFAWTAVANEVVAVPRDPSGIDIFADTELQDLVTAFPYIRVSDYALNDQRVKVTIFDAGFKALASCVVPKSYVSLTETEKPANARALTFLWDVESVPEIKADAVQTAELFFALAKRGLAVRDTAIKDPNQDWEKDEEKFKFITKQLFDAEGKESGNEELVFAGAPISRLVGDQNTFDESDNALEVTATGSCSIKLLRVPELKSHLISRKYLLNHLVDQKIHTCIDPSPDRALGTASIVNRARINGAGGSGGLTISCLGDSGSFPDGVVATYTIRAFNDWALSPFGLSDMRRHTSASSYGIDFLAGVLPPFEERTRNICAYLLILRSLCAAAIVNANNDSTEIRDEPDLDTASFKEIKYGLPGALLDLKPRGLVGPVVKIQKDALQASAVTHELLLYNVADRPTNPKVFVDAMKQSKIEKALMAAADGAPIIDAPLVLVRKVGDDKASVSIMKGNDVDAEYTLPKGEIEATTAVQAPITRLKPRTGADLTIQSEFEVSEEVIKALVSRIQNTRNKLISYLPSTNNVGAGDSDNTGFSRVIFTGIAQAADLTLSSASSVVTYGKPSSGSLVDIRKSNCHVELFFAGKQVNNDILHAVKNAQSSYDPCIKSEDKELDPGSLTAVQVYRPDHNKPDHSVKCIAVSDSNRYLAATFELVEASPADVHAQSGSGLHIDDTEPNLLESFAWESGDKAGERVVELQIPGDPMATEPEWKLINLCSQLEAMRKSILGLFESQSALFPEHTGAQDNGREQITLKSAVFTDGKDYTLNEWTQPVTQPTDPTPAESSSKVVTISQADCRLVLYSPDFSAKIVKTFLQEKKVDICGVPAEFRHIEGSVQDSGVVVFVSSSGLKYKLKIQIGKDLAAEFEGYNTDGVFVKGVGGSAAVTISTGTVDVHGSYVSKYQVDSEKFAARVDSIASLYREISTAQHSAPELIVNPLIASVTFTETSGSPVPLLTPVSIAVPTDNKVMEIWKDDECVMRVFGVEVATWQHKQFVGALANSKLTPCRISNTEAQLDLSAYDMQVLKGSGDRAEVRFAAKNNHGYLISYLVKDGDSIFLPDDSANPLPNDLKLPSITNSYSKALSVGPLFVLAQYFLSVTGIIEESLKGLNSATPISRPVYIDATAIRVSGVLVYTSEFPILSGSQYEIIAKGHFDAAAAIHYAMEPPPKMDSGTIGRALRLHHVRATVDDSADDSSEFIPAVAVWKSDSQIKCLADETGSGDLFLQDMFTLPSSGVSSTPVTNGLYLPGDPAWDGLSKTCAHLSRNRANIEIGLKETVQSLAESSIKYEPLEEVTIKSSPPVEGPVRFDIPSPPQVQSRTQPITVGDFTLSHSPYGFELTSRIAISLGMERRVCKINVGSDFEKPFDLIEDDGKTFLQLYNLALGPNGVCPRAKVDNTAKPQSQASGSFLKIVAIQAGEGNSKIVHSFHGYTYSVSMETGTHTLDSTAEELEFKRLKLVEIMLLDEMIKRLLKLSNKCNLPEKYSVKTEPFYFLPCSTDSAEKEDALILQSGTTLLDGCTEIILGIELKGSSKQYLAKMVEAGINTACGAIKSVVGNLATSPVEYSCNREAKRYILSCSFNKDGRQIFAQRYGPLLEGNECNMEMKCEWFASRIGQIEEFTFEAVPTVEHKRRVIKVHPKPPKQFLQENVVAPAKEIGKKIVAVRQGLIKLARESLPAAPSWFTKMWNRGKGAAEGLKVAKGQQMSVVLKNLGSGSGLTSQGALEWFHDRLERDSDNGEVKRIKDDRCSQATEDWGLENFATKTLLWAAKTFGMAICGEGEDFVIPAARALIEGSKLQVSATVDCPKARPKDLVLKCTFTGLKADASQRREETTVTFNKAVYQKALGCTQPASIDKKDKVDARMNECLRSFYNKVYLTGTAKIFAIDPKTKRRPPGNIQWQYIAAASIDGKHHTYAMYDTEGGEKRLIAVKVAQTGNLSSVNSDCLTSFHFGQSLDVPAAEKMLELAEMMFANACTTTGYVKAMDVKNLKILKSGNPIFERRPRSEVGCVIQDGGRPVLVSRYAVQKRDNEFTKLVTENNAFDPNKYCVSEMWPLYASAKQILNIP